MPKMTVYTYTYIVFCFDRPLILDIDYIFTYLPVAYPLQSHAI